MPCFLYSAVNREGQRVTERIEANNTSAARYALETRGYCDVSFETDDFQASVDKLSPDYKRPEGWTAEMEMEARRASGVGDHVWLAFKLNSVFWLPLAIWNGLTLVKGPPFSFWGWLGFALVAAFVVYFIVIVMPSIVFQLILVSSAWARGDELRAWVRRMRWLKRWMNVPVPEFELDMRLGYALALEGRLDSALLLAKKYETDPTVTKAMYCGRVASFYSAVGQHQQALAMRAQTAELPEATAVELVDYALVYARDLRDATTARRILERVEGVELAAMAQPALKLCQGIVALESGAAGEACTLFQEALKLYEPFAPSPAGMWLQSLIHAFLALGLAGNGDRAAAIEHLRISAPYLIAHKKQELISRCEQATGFSISGSATQQRY